MAAAATLKKRFREADTDGCGYVNAGLLREVMKEVLPNFTDLDLDRILGHFGEKVPYAAFIDSLFGKEPSHGRLAGKVAIVTGAGSAGPGWGVGKAIAVAMSREGAAVGLVDVNSAAAEETAEVIRSEGGISVVLPKCDISKVDEVNAMVAACEKELGPVTTLVNNVGLVCPGDVTSVPLGKWELINNINLLGAYNCTRACVTSFLKSGKKCSIVNISSISSLRCLRSEVAYACSKAGMNSLTFSVAREFAGRNIRCNNVAPGIIETPLVWNAYKDKSPEELQEIMVMGHEAGMPLLCPAPEPPSGDCAAKLAGKVAVVTGTAFCGAIAKTFVKHGASVLLACDDADAICAEVGSGCTAYKCDLTLAEAVEGMVKHCVEALGGVDLLVNGPGVECCKSLEDTSSEEFASVYKRNATSVLLTMRFAIPQMLERGAGAIVNMSPIAGQRYLRPECAMAAAAGSVNTMTQQTAAEFAPKGVRCNGLVPFVMGSASLDGYGYDVANAALYLCSSESRYISGQIINVDMSQASRVSVKM